MCATLPRVSGDLHIQPRTRLPRSRSRIFSALICRPCAPRLRRRAEAASSVLKPASRRKSARLSVPGSRPVRSCAPHRRTSSNRPKGRSPTVRVPASQWRTARGVTPTASASCSTLMSRNRRWRCRAWGRRDCAIPEAKRSEQFTATVHDGAILIPAKADAGIYRPELGAIAGRPSGRALCASRSQGRPANGPSIGLAASRVGVSECPERFRTGCRSMPEWRWETVWPAAAHTLMEVRAL
jgi:hypothetical protein